MGDIGPEGHRVNDIGSRGTLQFNNVREKSAGTYTLTIYYLDRGNGIRILYISVNGGPAKVLQVRGLGTWNLIGTISIPVSLNAGSDISPWLKPGASHPHRWAFLFRWRLRTSHGLGCLTPPPQA